jgi:two-component system response regulator RegA
MLNPTDLGLLIDDDELYVRTLQRSLSRRGLETRTATGIAEALRVAEEIRPAFALVDLRLGEDSGLTLIRPLRALRADMRILLVTGYASVATAVEAIKRGADDYLPKPATAPMILRTLGLVKPESVTIETTMTRRCTKPAATSRPPPASWACTGAPCSASWPRNRGRNAKYSWTDLCGCDIRSHPWLVRVRHIVAPWNPPPGPCPPRKTLNLLRSKQNLPRECDHSSQA